MATRRSSASPPFGTSGGLRMVRRPPSPPWTSRRMARKSTVTGGFSGDASPLCSCLSRTGSSAPCATPAPTSWCCAGRRMPSGGSRIGCGMNRSARQTSVPAVNTVTTKVNCWRGLSQRGGPAQLNGEVGGEAGGEGLPQSSDVLLHRLGRLGEDERAGRCGDSAHEPASEAQPEVDIHENRRRCVHEDHPLRFAADHHLLQLPFALALPLVSRTIVDDLAGAFR